MDFDTQDRVGTVLVFKKGVKEKEIHDTLKRIQDILDPEAFGVYNKGVWERKSYNLEWFNSNIGGPVWYVP